MLSRVPTIAVDVALAVLFIGVNAFEVLLPADDGVAAGSTAVNLVVLCVFPAFLVLRRRAPMLCWALMHGEFVLSGLFVRHSGFAFGTSLPACIATYTVARYSERRWARLALTSGPLIWLGVLVADGATSKTMSGVGFFVVSTIAAWGTGRLLGRLSERDEELQVARDRLLAEQALREEAAVREERARIALEMQAVVAVAVEGMVARLGTESGLLRAEGDDVSWLSSAEQAGRQALVELRRTTGVLRPDEGVDRVPTLADAEELLGGYRDAGLEVTWRADDFHAAPRGASFAAFRILQEALTNALKHGGRGPVHVTVGYDGEALVLGVRNRLQPIPSTSRHPSGRHGLVGMRERVAAFGGSLRAGVVGDDFEVRAQLPTRGEALP
jgi:signal transduction histidine kinase